MIKGLRFCKLLLLTSFIGLNALSIAQTPNTATGPGSGTVTKHIGTNYTFSSASNVRTWDVRKPMTSEADVLSYAAYPPIVQQTTLYVDSLGRPIQTVVRGVTPAGNDLIIPVEYDQFGREVFKYMPYAASTSTGEFKSDAFTAQDNFLASVFTNDSYFYGQTDYEASPLNKTIKTYAQGTSWVGKSVGVGVGYAMNTASEVRIWNIALTSGSIPTSTASYAANLLLKTTTTDESGNQVVEFKDKDDRVILKKVQANTTDWLSTYYVYDDIGRLRFVIPPKAVAYLSDPLLSSVLWQFESSTWSGSTIAKELCFSYEYDTEGRTIIKRVPGAGQVYMIYDARDRLVMTQDENMRTGNKWLYTKYDALNRPVKTGLWYTGSGSSPSFAELTTAASTSTNYPQPTSGDEILTETFYDNYDWVSGSESQAGFTATFATKNTGNNDYFYSADNDNFPYPQGLTPNYQVLGAVTGSKAKVLDGSTNFLYALNFYDDRNRVIQTQSTNYGNGSTGYASNKFKDTVTTQYSFSGQVLNTLMAHKKGGVGTQNYKVSTHNDYDGAGRLSEVFKKVGNSLKTKILHNDYDELGQLKQKKLGQERTSLASLTYTSTPIDILKYEYNVRGWLRGINKAYARNEGSSTSWFGMELDYDFGFSSNQLNGNIAGIRWRGKSDGEQRAYGFNYDKANRLLSADFNQYGSAWDKTKMDFSTTNLTYDANGNIKTMKQEGMRLNTKLTIDNLIYNYTTSDNTNKLFYVKDGENDPTSTLGDFKEVNSNTSQDYEYDYNGNMVKDLNKGIVNGTANGITYNYLNLPSVITVSGKGTITYLYDAAGTKLQKTTVDNTGSSTITTVTKYVNLFTYQNDTLQFIAHEEGRIRPVTHKQSDTMYYDYFEKDHLGNVRVVLTDQKKQDIYPAAALESPNNNTNALNVEKMYYDILGGNIVAKPQAVANYENNNNQTGNTTPPPNTNPYYSIISGNSGNMYKLGGTSTSKRSGLGITLKVMTGDVVDIYGKSYYNTNGATPNNSTYSLLETTAFNALMAMFAGSSAVGVGSHGASANDLLNNPGTQTGAEDLLNSMPTPTNRPKASINWALLDEQFQVVASNCGSDGVSSNSDVLKDHHRVVNILKSGYLYVYCSNESDIAVFFDNLQLVHTRSPLLEENHYYSFGLPMAGLSSQAMNFGEPKNKYGFNGKEKQSSEFADGSGMEWLDFGVRMYDAQIGRWFAVDPLSDSMRRFSPYAYTFDNPVGFIDYEGMVPIPHWMKQIAFAMKAGALPTVGTMVGFASQDGTNISSNSKRFAVNIGLPGSHAINTVRHTLQSAIMTVKFGRDLSRKIANTHEDDAGLDHNQNWDRAPFGNLDDADQLADKLNNKIGRDLGGMYSGTDPSQKELAAQVLTKFFIDGLWTVNVVVNKKTKVQTYVVTKTKLSEDEFKKAMAILFYLDNNGFTQTKKKK